MDDHEDFSDVAALYYSLLTITSLLVLFKNGRRWWTRPFLNPNSRNHYGAYTSIFTYFKLEDHEMFYQFMRMSVREFAYLHSKVEKILKPVGRRPGLSSDLKLAAVIGYYV